MHFPVYSSVSNVCGNYSLDNFIRRLITGVGREIVRNRRDDKKEERRMNRAEFNEREQSRVIRTMTMEHVDDLTVEKKRKKKKKKKERNH